MSRSANWRICRRRVTLRGWQKRGRSRRWRVIMKGWLRYKKRSIRRCWKRLRASKRLSGAHSLLISAMRAWGSRKSSSNASKPRMKIRYLSLSFSVKQTRRGSLSLKTSLLKSLRRIWRVTLSQAVRSRVWRMSSMRRTCWVQSVRSLSFQADLLEREAQRTQSFRIRAKSRRFQGTTLACQGISELSRRRKVSRKLQSHHQAKTLRKTSTKKSKRVPQIFPLWTWLPKIWSRRSLRPRSGTTRASRKPRRSLNLRAKSRWEAPLQAIQVKDPHHKSAVPRKSASRNLLSKNELNYFL